jgi:hypothetical protein
MKSAFPVKAVKSGIGLSVATFISLVLLMPALTVMAKPTQSEVFKSIQDNVNETSNSNINTVPWICGGVALILIVAWFGRRQTLQANPKALNNPHRLAKEIVRLTSLKPGELKQVKLLADETRIKGDQPVCSPLVLLLCPSMLTKAVADRKTRADRRTLLYLIKKLH